MPEPVDPKHAHLHYEFVPANSGTSHSLCILEESSDGRLCECHDWKGQVHQFWIAGKGLAWLV